MLSRLNLLFTKKSTVILYAIGALFAIFVLGVSSAQILISYANHAGFDVPATSFYSELILFVPFYIVNGLLLRLLIERWRIFRRSKRMFHIAEYGAPEGFSPAHLGLLIDNDIRTEEVVATIYDLEQRGIVAISDTAVTLLTTGAPVTSSEEQLIDKLFSRGNPFVLDGSNAALFVDASDAFRRAMLTEMRDRNMLPMPLFNNRYAHKIMNAVFILASYVSIVSVVFLLKSPMEILTVQYPRYAMNIGQPIVAIGLILLVLGVAYGGFTTDTLTRDGRLHWRFAAGYRLYIVTVFKGKFERENKERADKELQKILPYAIAFSIDKKPVDDFIRKLGL